MDKLTFFLHTGGLFCRMDPSDVGFSAEFFAPPQSNRIQTDAFLIQFVEINLGTDWYGI
jgi:hypothetical protein